MNTLEERIAALEKELERRKYIIDEQRKILAEAHEASMAYRVQVKYGMNEVARLEAKCSELFAGVCPYFYSGERGHQRCSEIDRLTRERDEAMELMKGAVHSSDALNWRVDTLSVELRRRLDAQASWLRARSAIVALTKDQK